MSRQHNLQLRDVDLFFSATEKKVDINLKRDFSPQVEMFPQTTEWKVSSFTYYWKTQITQMWIYRPSTREHLAFYVPANLLPAHIRKEINRILKDSKLSELLHKEN